MSEVKVMNADDVRQVFEIPFDPHSSADRPEMPAMRYDKDDFRSVLIPDDATHVRVQNPDGSWGDRMPLADGKDRKWAVMTAAAINRMDRDFTTAIIGNAEEEFPDQVVPPGTPSNAHYPLIGDGPGRIRVEYNLNTDLNADFEVVPVRSERREVVVYVRGEMIVAMLNAGQPGTPEYLYVPDYPDLPAGYVVERIRDDFHRNAFAVVVSHPSFEAVPDGMPAPEWPGLLESRWRAVKVVHVG